MTCILPGTTLPCSLLRPVVESPLTVQESVAAASSSSALPMFLGFVAIAFIHHQFMKGEIEEWPIEEEE